MGTLSSMMRCGRFIDEFQADVLKVYGLPTTPWLKGQWLQEDVECRVRMKIDLEFPDGMFVEATVAGPIFYDAEASDSDNVEALVQAMDVENGLGREEIEVRLRKIGLIAGKR